MSSLLTLNNNQQAFLLKLARDSISNALGSGPAPQICPDDPVYQESAGAFVTLHKNETLRGCIGYIAPIRSLYEAVRENALNAALHDPRFPKLETRELDQIHIEISVLSPPVPITSWEDIIIGQHGILLFKNRAQSVFLPQVAVEQKWTLEETLTHLSLKAGLGPDDWRTGTDFQVFEAIIFGEKKQSKI